MRVLRFVATYTLDFAVSRVRLAAQQCFTTEVNALVDEIHMENS
jgi:hypothetical protein